MGEADNPHAAIEQRLRQDCDRRIKIAIMDMSQQRDEWEERCLKAEAKVRGLEEDLWDALFQGAFVEGNSLDNMCMSTWEGLSAYFAEKGWLTTENRRIYKIVPLEERPKQG